MTLELLQSHEQQHHPQGGERAVEQRHRDGGNRPDDRADVRDELHQSVEGAEEDGIALGVGEDAEHAEDGQRSGGAGAHDEAEQNLPADVI